MKNKTIIGIDILKFLLAIMIVAAHTQLFMELFFVYNYAEILESIAVPIFMAISAYFFFKKVYVKSAREDTKSLLLKSLNRLAVLFLCWYLLMLPMTYLRFFSVANLKEIIYAVLLSCTFNGYWFIKALMINTCIFYFCREGKVLFFCIILSWLVYLFFSYNYVYHFVDYPFSPYYSFYYHLAYYSIGVMFARYGDKLLSKNANNLLLIASFMLLFILGSQDYFNPLYRLLSIPLIFMLFYQLDLEPNPYYKTMREMSIILYMVQFVLIWLYNGACDLWLQPDSMIYSVLQYSIIRFLLVTMASISIAWLILKYEKFPKYSFLHYLH